MRFGNDKIKKSQLSLAGLEAPESYDDPAIFDCTEVFGPDPTLVIVIPQYVEVANPVLGR